MAIKNDDAKRAGADAARRAAEEARKRAEAQAKATTARSTASASASKRAVAFRADELSSGKGGALRANATKLLGATLPTSVKVEPPPPPATQSYVVQAGDTLTSIATKFKTTVPELQKLNNLADPNAIMVGQNLTVPGTAAASPPADAWQGKYVVKPGDTLTAIASKFGTSVAELQQRNGITDPNNVWVGTELSVPGAPPASTTTGAQGANVPPATVLGSSIASLAEGERAAWQNNPDASQYWQYGGGHEEAWCADFVSTLYGKANAPLGDKGVGFASVPAMKDWFAQGPTAADPRQRSLVPGTEMPRVGDVVIFDWDADGSIDHTGVVTAVRSDGSFDTIEGNTNGSGEWNGEVASHTYTERSEIAGFGRLEVTPTTKNYTVEKGDSGMWALSAKLGVNYHALLQANPGIDPGALKPGQTIVVPTLENKPPQAPPSVEPERPRRPPNSRGPFMV